MSSRREVRYCILIKLQLLDHLGGIIDYRELSNIRRDQLKVTMNHEFGPAHFETTGLDAKFPVY